MNALICPWESAKYLFFSSNVPNILYYSHVPAIVAALFLGFFVYFKGRTLSSKLLLIENSLFSLYVILDLIIWASNKSDLVMFLWSLIVLVEVLIFAFGLYLVYAFVKDANPSFKKIIFFILPLIPFILLISTKYNLIGIRNLYCDADEGPVALYYSYLLELFFVISIIFFIIKSCIYEKNKEIRTKIIFFGIGIALFLLAFSWGNIIGSFTEDWQIAQYGLFGMPVFIAFLVYLIVKFKAFEVKLLAAQALVVGIIILVGSQFFFIRSKTNMILNGITFVLSCGFGWWLIRSVKSENARKEQLQFLADQLAGSNAKLQKMDNTKTEFISIASHQLRTPPTAIKGYASLLLEGSYGKLQPDQIYALNNIYRRNDDMILLIDNLLNTSRIEAGTVAFDFGKFKMEDLLQDIHESLIIKAKTNKLTLEIVKPATALPEITSDKAKLKETLSNLVENAIKYTKQGGVKVETSLQKGFTVLSHESSNPTPVAGVENRDPEKDVVRLVVADTGIGIPETELPFLFQKFSRGKDISRLNVSGTGLGLFVGKKIMEQLGGQVWAESKGLNKGSRFIMEIPVEGKEMPQN